MTLNCSGTLQYASGYGSAATAYGVRAFVKFNGKGTLSNQILRGVSSVTDNGTGRYRVNFSFTMPDAHYAVVGSACITVNSEKAVIYAHRHGSPTTTNCYISTGDGSFADCAIVTVGFIR